MLAEVGRMTEPGYRGRRTSNQHTGAGRITAREADTIRGCYRKLLKIAGRNNLYVKDVRNLIAVLEAMDTVLRESDR